nr:hypothetical protein BaRGS_017155 [Batillaria attramentaria]
MLIQWIQILLVYSITADDNFDMFLFGPLLELVGGPVQSEGIVRTLNVKILTALLILAIDRNTPQIKRAESYQVPETGQAAVNKLKCLEPQHASIFRGNFVLNPVRDGPGTGRHLKCHIVPALMYPGRYVFTENRLDEKNRVFMDWTDIKLNSSIELTNATIIAAVMDSVRRFIGLQDKSVADWLEAGGEAFTAVHNVTDVWGLPAHPEKGLQE